MVCRFANGDEFKADDVHIDELTDLAVIGIVPPNGVLAASFGSLRGLEIGDCVLRLVVRSS